MSKKLDRVQLAQFILKRHSALEGKRAPWDAWHEEIARYFMPRKAEILTSRSEPSSQRHDVLFDGTGIQANITLSNGCLSYLSPADKRWFGFDPPPYLKGVDPAEQYFSQCSEIAMNEMAASNFYEAVHELYLDRGCFGTAVMWVEEGKRSTLNFRKFDVGTFSIAEDSEGYVDTLSREFSMTSRQAVQQFGYDDVSDVIQKAFDSEDAQQMEREFRFVHQVFPREADDIELDETGRAKRDVANKPIASIYVERDKKLVVRIGGYDELPFFATRYLKWVEEHAYGWSPAWAALPDARQLNFLQKQMDALAELTAFPRFLIPDSHEGAVDFRASGVTYFDTANPNAIPREWATNGRYDVGKDRVTEKQKQINEAFHVDLFKLFANLDRPQMTAREVAERANEKLIQFSPTFARMTTEFFTPLLRRVWAILTRLGKMPPPPEETIQQSMTGEAYLPQPEVSYSSRIALAIKGLENASRDREMESWGPIMSGLKPEIADNVNWDAMFRDSVRNAGLPQRWLLDEELVAKMRKARAEQMEAMQQEAQQMQMAEAASKVGAIKSDSMIGQVMKNQANGKPMLGR